MKPDWEGFGRAIMEAWPEGGLDGFDLQDIAEKYGVIREVPYDPDKHGTGGLEEWGMEPGNPWFVPNYEERER